MENINISLEGIDYLVVGIYLLIMVLIGFWVSFIKKKKEGENLFLAGRTLKWPSIGLTMWGTNVGPSMLVVSAASGYMVGIAGANFSWYAFIFIFLLAMVFSPIYINLNVSTLPEFIGKRFNNFSRELLAWYSLITIVISWLGMTLFAGGLLVSQIMQWPLVISIIVLVIISAFFTIAGGLEAIALTNVFQMTLLILVSLSLTVIGVVKAGGVMEVYQSAPDGYWNLFLPNNHPDYPWVAIILGYPVIGIWFWCTDQSMVQSVLGAKNLKQGQIGTNFTGWLKILDMFIFILPGVLCFLLFPNIGNPEEAYATMVSNLLPVGMRGLVMAVLVAALISTIDSALNSLSTIFTLDIFVKRYKPDASNKQVIGIGRIVATVGAIVGILIAVGISKMEQTDLFMLFQSILGFLAPSMAAVFIMGVISKRVNAASANIVLSIGSLISLTIGYCLLTGIPNNVVWDRLLFHPLVLSFILFIIFGLFMYIYSIFTKPVEARIPSLNEAYEKVGRPKRSVWILWILLAITMIVLYVFFN
jgi:solute:Na+ symporter, SSS family